jgi:putative protease
VSGADVIYLGLSEGFQARARSNAFSLARLPQLVERVHMAGVKLYLTVNTLVFERELEALEQFLRALIAAGVDALIIQDPAAALLAHALCPELPLHASTQMTISSVEGARFAASLGISRVVLPRELSAKEVARFTAASPMAAEVFVHGALCMAWSGQCLTSEAFSDRSANRGQCSQACRMPYGLVVDGAPRELGDVRYLLSPSDLAAHDQLPQLMAAGVHALKIEGRYKSGAYVISAVDSLRNWRDALARGPSAADSDQLERDLFRTRLTYSRGASPGFLAGDDHQSLVEGRSPKHRGMRMGQVRSVRGRTVQLTVPASFRERLRAGMGVMFEVGDPERDDTPGGPIFAVRWLEPAQPARSHTATSARDARSRNKPVLDRSSQGARSNAAILSRGPQSPSDSAQRGKPLMVLERSRAATSPPDAQSRGSQPGAAALQDTLLLELSFGDPGPDLARIHAGVWVWLTGDPQIAREAEHRAKNPSPIGRIALTFEVSGQVGQPLSVRAAGSFSTRALASHAQSPSLLTAARGAGLTEELLRDKLAALGGSPFHLTRLDLSQLPTSLHLPVSELKQLRRNLVDELTSQLARVPWQVSTTDSCLPQLRTRPVPLMAAEAEAPRIVPLCRTAEQLAAVIAAGVSPGDEVELDFMEFVGLGAAVRSAREAGLRVTIATIRVQKPGEEGYDRRVAALAPEAVLVRHWGALMHFAERAAEDKPRLHGDFSLNITNAISARHVLGFGLDTITASHDLDREQLLALLAAAPRGRVAVTLHHHVATFHNSHCVYAHLLSDGSDYRSCGRPCETHKLALRDYAGHDHPVIVDVSCRNTVFNAQAQSAAPLVPELKAHGVNRFRIEFVWETADQVTQTLASYRALISGKISPQSALRKVGVHEQYGVTLLRNGPEQRAPAR